MLQVTVLRGENASAKSLHSVVQSLESDKVKLELKVKNLELQLKENKRQLSSSSGNMMTVAPPHPRSTAPCKGAVSGQDALLPDVPFHPWLSHPLIRRGLDTTQVPCEGACPVSPLLGLPPWCECGEKHKLVDAGCHPSTAVGSESTQ